MCMSKLHAGINRSLTNVWGLVGKMQKPGSPMQRITSHQNREPGNETTPDISVLNDALSDCYQANLTLTSDLSCKGAGGLEGDCAP